MKSAFCLGCSLLLLATASTARGSGDSTYAERIGTDFSTAWSDAGSLFGAPLHFDEEHWIGTVLVLGAVAATLPLDNSARSLAARNQSRTGGDLAGIGRAYGNAFVAAGISGAVYAGGLLLEKDRVRETGLMMFETLAFAGLTTTVIKSLAGRSRPYLEEGPYRFHGPTFSLDRTSMPSGHSTVAFSISSVLAARFHSTWAGIGLYSLAALTAASRVYDDEHWLSDTFFGAAVGTAFGIGVAALHEKEEEGSSLRLTPLPSGLRAEFIF